MCASESSWLELRALPETELAQLADAETGGDDRTRARALLTQADRALNQSVAASSVFLQQAQPIIVPGSDEEDFANALQCQLFHRQGLPTAATFCEPLIEADSVSRNRLIQAYRHATLSYYFYREGDHARSLEEAYETLEVAQELGDHGMLAAGHNVVGLHFATRLLPRRSMPHLESAWEHASQMPNPEFKVVVQLNLASNYTYLGRGLEAMRLLREVEDSPTVTLYPSRRLAYQSMVSQARVVAGDLEGAEEELLGVIAEVSDKVLPDAMTFAYTALGWIQLAAGRPRDALESLDRVLEITGEDFATGMDHPRIQLMVVAYARALRESGRGEDSQRLLELVIDNAPVDQPDQLLVDAYDELSRTLAAAGDRNASVAAREDSARLEQMLWDESFKYEYAQLNAAMEADRRELELERARERQAVLEDRAERERTLRLQSWLIAAMLVAVVLLFQSRRMQKKIALSERASNERLEGLVKTRTQELEDAMAERMRVEIDRRNLIERLSEREKLHALGQLTAGVAHDFNNLMTVVSLSADHLRSGHAGQQNEASVELLDDILAAADTGSKITDGLLAYVRKQPLQPVPLQLDQFVEKSLPLFRNSLGERMQLETQLESCRVLVDEGQLTSSLLNLMLNAKEAMNGSGRIELAVSRSGGEAEISLRDRGSGMSRETRRRAFEPFYTTKESGEGTGLGLSMVYGFARQSGGDLSIESKIGVGTTVRLVLPLADEAEDPRMEPAPEEPARFSAGASVLVVEDRELLRRMLDRTLTQMGMEVSVAGSADDALALVSSQGLPDVLVSDIVMPGSMDGCALAGKLRESDPNLAVLLISGYADSVDENCRFLRKPFTMAELEQAVQAALHDAAQQVPATP